MGSDVTTADVIGAVRRHWFVALVCLALTILATGIASSRPGVYSTRVSVVLVAPHDVSNQRSTLISSSDTLIAMAGLLERTVNASQTKDPAPTQDVSLTGMGIREGTRITLPNSGGQWNYNFRSPSLTVQAVDTTPAAVIQRRDAAVEQIVQQLTDLQDADAVPQRRRISTSLVPEAAPVSYVHGKPLASGAVTAALGLGLTLTFPALTDLMLARLRRRRRGPVAARRETASVA